MKVLRPTLLTGLLCVAALAPSIALACPTCGSGDPTLTSMGTEAPFRNRVRFSSTLRGWERSWAGVRNSEQRMRELRMDLGLAWAPHERLVIGAILPMQLRQLQGVNLSREQGLGLGEAEVTARAFLYRDRSFSPNHLVHVLGGLKIPTATYQRNAQGIPFSQDAQLGTGSWDAIAGLGYTGFLSADWSAFVSSTVFWTTQGNSGHRAGRQLRSTAAVQWQPGLAWALRLGADARLEGRARDNGELTDADAGFVGYLAPDLLWSPQETWTLQLGVRAPVYQSMRGNAREGLIALVAWVVDL